MAIDGTSKLSRVQLAQLTLDYTKQTASIQTVIALISPTSGAVAYMRQEGGVLSAESHLALRELVLCLESDAAKLLLEDYEPGGSTVATRQPRAQNTGGLAEHLGADLGVEDR